jgi:hypothetical protein
LNWEPVASPPVNTQANARNDIVQAKYFHPVLTEQLPELVPGGQWGEGVVHPKTPLQSEAGSDAPQQPQPGAAAAAQPAGGQPAGQPPQTANGEKTDLVPHVLLRLFDYTVQPGRKYRYRVTLSLLNPNNGVAPQFLENPDSAAASELHSKPTDPTSAITIPDGHGLIAGPVDGGTRYTEPSAKILVTAIDANAGLKAATELTVRRGAVANTGPVAVKVPHPLDKSPRDLNRSFESNIMVLDIHGGKDVTRRKHDPPLTSPGEILILDPSGKMSVRSELEDREQFANLIIREEPVRRPTADKDKEKEESKDRKGSRIRQQ